jgi:hypothetical protein
MSIRSRLIASLGALAVLPATASAQSTPGVHIDPSGSDPPGVVYQLPLDSARKDAAPPPTTAAPTHTQATPKRKVAHSAPAPSGGGSGPSSGGSGGSGGTPSGGGSGGSAGANVANASAIHSENGLGSSAKVPGLGRSVRLQRTAAETSGATGSTVPLVALGVILFLGGAAAITGRRIAQHWQT